MGKTLLFVSPVPPPELAAVLAAARTDPADEGAWRAVRDLHLESGRQVEDLDWHLWPELAGPVGCQLRLIWRPYRAVEMCRALTLDDWMAHGPLLCRWHPVRSVRIKDMEPFPVALRAGGADGRGWNAWDQKTERLSGGLLASAVPTAIWNLLDGPSPYFSLGDCWARYGNARDAEDSLSDALVRWALGERA